MKKLFLILICLTISGCATAKFIQNVQIGMTKVQIISSCGSPTSWNRQIINGKTYESLNYSYFGGDYDFVDNILVGYSRRDPFGDMKYHSANGIDDVRNYNNPATK
jgi:hypothetical protein